MDEDMSINKSITFQIFLKKKGNLNSIIKQCKVADVILKIWTEILANFDRNKNTFY